MPGMSAGLARAHAKIILTPIADTGSFLLEAKGWKSWNFSFFKTGVVTGGMVTIYGTHDPDCAGTLGQPNFAVGYVQPTGTLDQTKWFPLVANAAASEAAGSYANPITVFDGTQSLVYDKPLIAVRAVANAFTGGGSITLEAFVTP